MKNDNSEDLSEYGMHVEEQNAEVDLVCGMEINNPKYKVEHKRKSYGFCSQTCKTHFQNDPEKYIG